MASPHSGPHRPAAGDVIAAIATPPGKGGVGIIRISGPDLGPFAKKLLGCRCSERLQPRLAQLFTLRQAEGDPIDQALVLHFPGPKSFTGEDVLELQGHGSPLVLQALLARCCELGARLARPGEFSERAFLNGTIDLAQAEAIADLIDASTQSAARAAMRSLQGEFSQAIGALSTELVALRTLTEATLDFPEEEVDFLKAARAFERLAAIDAHLEQVLRQARRGSLLRSGLNVVLVGQPNVGKSSLLNRLAGEELAIVTPIAGTTRDALRGTVQIHGIPLHIIDTAGLRETDDAVEQIGIDRTWREIERADLILMLADAQGGLGPAERAIIERLPAGLPRLKVFNKIDLAGQAPSSGSLEGVPAVWISARDNLGLDLLEQALLDAIGWGAEDGDVYVARERHLDALRRARSHLATAHDSLDALELFAEELRYAHLALQEITGEYTPDDLLGNIFSTFCIGK